LARGDGEDSERWGTRRVFTHNKSVRKVIY